jgi:hypothetical protein
MSSHFLSVCTGFHGVRPSYTGLTTYQKSSKGRCFGEVSAVQRSVQMAQNFADMWRIARGTHRYFGPNLLLYAAYALGLRPPERRDTLTIYRTSWFAGQNLGIRTEGSIQCHTLTSMKTTCRVFCRLGAWYGPLQ